MRLPRNLWPLASGTGVVLVIAAMFATALLLNRENTLSAVGKASSSGRDSAALANPDVNLGSPAGDRPAPGFVLRDQTGRRTSLAQFRGQVVVLAFVDPHCTTICPLTTQSMVEALHLLGPAAAQVQLLGINANPLATNVADVADYTRAHQMQGRWRLLTGTLPDLERVWRAYHVYVAAAHNDIDHEPVIFLIDGYGRERTIYFTQMSYAGVSQQAQLLAEGIARLLPGAPPARQQVSLRYLPPLGPANLVRLPAVGPGAQTVVLGETHPHLLLFFAGWLDEEANLPAKLAVLDRYAITARQQGWPSPVAIDVRPTEPSAADVAGRLNRLAARLRTPIVEDTQGRLSDGYGVQDLPWFVLTSPSGRILWRHDGWLSFDALGQQVRGAWAEN